MPASTLPAASDGTTAVDPATWREVDLTMPDPQNACDSYTMQLLEPTSWISANSASVGNWVHLDLPELQIAGYAQVTAVKACPTIESGPGDVVLGTFQHVSNDIVDVNLQGESQPLQVTAGHLLWSLDRGGWVPAGELMAGERLAGENGPVVVESVTPDATAQEVYNLDVENDHRYLVTDLGVVAHNVDPCDTLIAQAQSGGLDSLIREGNPGSSPNIRELPGTEPDARKLFDGITSGGTTIKDTPTIVIRKMSDGSYVTYRPAGKVANPTTGYPPPTIDIHTPTSYFKLKLLP